MVTVRRFMFVSPCFTHFALCAALLCSRNKNVESAHALFFPDGSKSADDAWNALSSHLRSAQEIRGVRLIGQRGIGLF